MPILRAEFDFLHGIPPAKDKSVMAFENSRGSAKKQFICDDQNPPPNFTNSFSTKVLQQSCLYLRTANISL